MGHMGNMGHMVFTYFCDNYILLTIQTIKETKKK